MSARLMVIVAAALTAASPAIGADPVKPEAREASQPVNRPAEVLLASADQVRAPAQSGEQPNTTPVKRPRAARVTTCRCGDPEQH
jgi:hypothetical protein